MSITRYIKHLKKDGGLIRQDSKDCLETIFKGHSNTNEILILLQTLNKVGIQVDTLVGFTEAMRSAMKTLPITGDFLDICGTGGSQKNRFNASTAAAFILASQKIPILKHGNRGSHKPNGSFDFLESLGLPLTLSRESTKALYSQLNLGFLFARHYHTAVANVSAARKQLGARSIFNLLGPLCNPAQNSHHVLGTTNLSLGRLLAQAMQRLSFSKGLVIVGAKGLDELSPCGPATLINITPHTLSEHRINPLDLDVQIHTEHAIRGHSSSKNAEMFLQILQNGDINHPISDLICLNVAAGAFCIDAVKTLKEGVALARHSIYSKEAYSFFMQYKQQSISLR